MRVGRVETWREIDMKSEKKVHVEKQLQYMEERATQIEIFIP